MHQRKSKRILIYLFLLIIVSSISNNSINNLNLSKIQNIKISGLDQSDNQIPLTKIKYLTLENIFSINKIEIENLLNSNALVDSYNVFKIYPATLNIEIEKTKFFAKTSHKGKNYLIGTNGKLLIMDSEYNDLPYIFGKLNIKEILKFKIILDESKFNYDQIKDLYFFPSNRWDIKLKNGILLKLPNNLSKETLNLLNDILKKNVKENYSIVDARIKNQVILNEKTQ